MPLPQSQMQYIVSIHQMITMVIMEVFGGGTITSKEGEPTGDPTTKILRTWRVEAYKNDLPPIAIHLIEERGSKRYLDIEIKDGAERLGVAPDHDVLAGVVRDLVREYEAH